MDGDGYMTMTFKTNCHERDINFRKLGKMIEDEEK